MEYLLDTHVFIWAMEKNRRLTEDVKNIIANPNNKIFISVVAVWEIVLKKKKGLKVPKDVVGGILKSNFTLLSIDISHVLGIENLPDIHKDPFDRMLMSQAQEESLALITSDIKIWKYGQVSAGSQKKLSLIKA